MCRCRIVSHVSSKRDVVIFISFTIIEVVELFVYSCTAFLNNKTERITISPRKVVDLTHATIEEDNIELDIH